MEYRYRNIHKFTPKHVYKVKVKLISRRLRTWRVETDLRRTEEMSFDFPELSSPMPHLMLRKKPSVMKMR